MKSDDITIIGEAPRHVTPCGQRMKVYVVRCVCGKEFTALRNNVDRGHTRSCGCLKYRHPAYHGLRGTAIYRSWDCMIQRCYNPKTKAYKNYGARGVTVCGQWREFKVFYAWAISSGWKKGLELDRRNNNGNYEPSNCRWVTHSENNLNKRTNRLITFNGQTKTIKEWSDLTGLRYKTVQGRLDIMKWDIERVLTTPPGKAAGGRYAHLFRDIRTQL